RQWRGRQGRRAHARCPRSAGLDFEARPAGAAVGLGQAEGLDLQLAGAVGGAGQELGPAAWRQLEATLPADPGVLPGRWLEELGNLPGVAGIGAELDLLDAAYSGIRDASDALLT